MRGPVAVAVGAAVAAGGMYFSDPNQPGSIWPPCPLFALTGIQCPACGSTRMVHALLHGDLVAAWQLNAVMLVAGLPLLAWLWVRWFRAARRREPVPPVSAKVGIAVAAVAVTWMVVRNLVVGT
ncbi:hypothetical protein SUDANB95_01106 [Actinosynnema sp. ALI-1.44]